MAERRALFRSKSFPLFDVDRALSHGFQSTRDSLREIHYFLVEKDKADDLKEELDDLKKQLKDLIKKCTLLKSEAEDWKKICADLMRLSEDFGANCNQFDKKLQYAIEKYDNLKSISDLKAKFNNSEKELSDLKAKFNDLEKELSDSQSKCKDLQAKNNDLGEKLSEFQREINCREALSNFRRSKGGRDIDRRLMDMAGDLFHKHSPDLVELAQKSFPVLCKPYNISKFWRLMKLAHDLFAKGFPQAKFSTLMEEAHMKFPKENIPHEQFQTQMRKRYGLHRGASDLTIRLHFLTESAKRLFPKESSDERFVDLVILGHGLFQRFPDQYFQGIMVEAHKLFPEEFPHVAYSKTFTGMITILENLKASLKDRKSPLVCDIDNKLRGLQEVAMKFDWPVMYKSQSSQSMQSRNADFGKGFFFLCKKNSQSNRVTFHGKPVGMGRIELMQDVTKGKYVFEGVDIGLVVRTWSPDQVQ